MNSGPNTVFKSIMDAMYTGTYMDMYDAFFLMDSRRVIARVLDGSGYLSPSVIVHVSRL